MKRIGIIGLGLIGGSLGLALRRAMADVDVVGFARRKEVASRAVERGAVGRAVPELRGVVRGADLVIIATPVLAVREVLAGIAESLDAGAVVTDVASTKAEVMRWAEEFLPPEVSFVGGHPMAGREVSGIDAADAGLFTGCTYCLVRGPSATREAVDRLEGLVRSIGARPLLIDASEHDMSVAAISHLPLLLSSALVSLTARSEEWPRMAGLASSGFRDVTRLASGSPEMSRDICLTNREAILRWLDGYVHELGELQRLLTEQDAQVEQFFRDVKERRDGWLGSRGS
ncbi:MAG: prephenate dehydrogenase/arogenate dehydrogenase family protein [Chloroflexota bacterium]|nr:prephenate dehydrogenase/arogenate dehydrogenase family protein [Chloroflexota bacterium]